MSWTTNIGLWTCACLLLAETASALDFDESQRIYEETYVGEQSTPLTPEVDTTMVGGLIVSDFDNASLTGDALHIFIPNPAPPAPLESNLGLAHSPTPTTSTIGSASIGVRGRFANVLIAGTGDGWADVVVSTGIDIGARVYMISPGIAILGVGPTDLDGSTLVLLPSPHALAVLAGAPFWIDLFVDTNAGTASASVEISGFSSVSAPVAVLDPFVAGFTRVTQRGGVEDVIEFPTSFAVDFTGLELYPAIGTKLCGPGDLIAHWPFSGNAEDAGPCMLDGVPLGPTLTADSLGIPNSAYSFDGNPDEIDLGNSTLLRPSLPFTLSMFVRNRCPAGTECALFMNDRIAGIYSGFRMAVSFTSEGRWYVRLGDGGNPSPNSRRDAIAGTSLSTNLWHHIAAVVHSPTNVELYQDGVPLAVVYDGNGGAMQYVGGDAAIGVGAEGGDSFQGDIDEVHFFDRALSQAEIISLPAPTSANGFGTALGLLLAFWHHKARSNRIRRSLQQGPEVA